MTSPPQPHRPLIVDDLDLGVSGNQVEVATGKRKAANDRQRKAAQAEAEYEARRMADIERLWGRQRTAKGRQ
jgi:hypothetical protein